MNKEAQVPEIQSQEVQVPLQELEARFEELFVQLDDAISGIRVFVNEIKPYVKMLDKYRSEQLTAQKNTPEYWKQTDDYDQSDIGITNNSIKDKLESMGDSFTRVLERANDEIIF